jgi:hypothetical protein
MNHFQSESLNPHQVDAKTFIMHESGNSKEGLCGKTKTQCRLTAPRGLKSKAFACKQNGGECPYE